MRNIDALNNNISTLSGGGYMVLQPFFSQSPTDLPLMHTCLRYIILDKAICCIVLHWGSEIHSSVSQKLGVAAKSPNPIGYDHLGVSPKLGYHQNHPKPSKTRLDEIIQNQIGCTN